MSRINDLIKEMCPNGVKYLELYKVIKWNKRFSGVNKEWQPEIVSIKSNVSAQELKSLALDSGHIKLLSTGNFDGYTDRSVYTGDVNDLEVITIPSGGTANIKYYNGQFINSGNIIGTSTDYDKYYLKYIYYCLLNKNELVQSFFRGSSVQHPDMKQIIQIKIPIPPLEVQKEIVRILDKFGELEARKSQYEFWRGSLFKQDIDKMVTLETIGDVTKLAGFEFSEYVNYSDYGNIIALRGLNVKNGHLVLDDVKYVDNSDFSKLNRSKLYENDILYTYVGTVGQVGLVDKNDKYYLAPNVARIRIFDEKVNPKYVMHYLLTNEFKTNQLDALSGTSSMKNITMTNIRKFKIPVPSLEKQNRIVNILDRFDKLINDISVGLPAEIELRRKQYEYYRNKLLSFEELRSDD